MAQLPSTESEGLTSTSPTPQPAQQQRETVVDPRVVALRGMFPDYDDIVLQTILESAGGDQDLAIDTLLAMSDPDYRSEQPAPHPVVEQAHVFSQEELDEQFARQLVMIEQQESQERYVARQQGQGRPGGTWAPPPQPQGERPMGDNIQEQFSKIAESGKKTFGSLFSKVKAKIQEFDQGRAPSLPVDQYGQSSRPYQAWSPPSQPAYGQQPAYYDPNPASISQPTSAPLSPARTPSGGSNANAAPVHGYDVSSPTPPPNPVHQQLQRQPSPQPIPPPPIDGGKLGLLPKRPVSLLRDPPPNSSPPSSPSAHAQTSIHAAEPKHDDDDDDGLEYTENPFEEDGHSIKAQK